MIIQNEQTAGVWIHGNTKHGKSYTAEYKREYQRKYRKENRHIAIQRERKCKQDKIDHPEQYKCECGRTGAVLKAGWVVCTRCDALEKHEIAQELRKRHTIRDAIIKWNKPTDGMIEKAELPEWMRLWAIASSLQSSAMMLLRIDSRIEDDGKTITVYGHGKYELPIDVSAQSDPQPTITAFDMSAHETAEPEAIVDHVELPKQVAAVACKELGPRPPASINGKRNTEYTIWWQKSNPEKWAAIQSKAKEKLKVKLHEQNEIANADEVRCLECTRLFNREDAILRGFRFMRYGGNRVVCDECGKNDEEQRLLSINTTHYGNGVCPLTEQA